MHLGSGVPRVLTYLLSVLPKRCSISYGHPLSRKTLSCVFPSAVGASKRKTVLYCVSEHMSKNPFAIRALICKSTVAPV